MSTSMYLKNPDWADDVPRVTLPSTNELSAIEREWLRNRRQSSLLSTWRKFVDGEYLDLRIESVPTLYVDESPMVCASTSLPNGVYWLVFTGGYHDDWQAECEPYAAKNESARPDERAGISVRLRLDVNCGSAYLTVEEA